MRLLEWGPGYEVTGWRPGYEVTGICLSIGDCR